MTHRIVAWLAIGFSLFLVFGIGCKDKEKPEGAKEDHAQHSGMNHAKHDSDHAAQLILNTTPEKPRTGEPADLGLMLHDADGKMLKDFELNHEKLAHLIIARDGLDEFAHLHPEVAASGMMTAKYTFPQAGRYFVFLDHKAKGQPAETSKTTLVIEGDSVPAKTLVPDLPGLLKGDGHQANVDLRKSEKSQVMVFEVQDDAGKAVRDLQPYLGAMGHLVVLSADGMQYVHAHPLTEESPDGKVEFEVHFPGPGIYKAWGQFQRDGKVITIPVVVKNDGGGHRH